ncbi:tetratricopeptide repeat protein [Candidatus Peregrinibacteria bacterium]|nr:tetratricopeptide repeat protein [Candidatus Peregrinibacteria bacterium]
MIDFLLALICLLIMVLVFVHRWYLLEKGSLFGKMVLRASRILPSRLSKEDHEVTAKEMIPDPSTVDPKLKLKGENFYKKAEVELKRNNWNEAERYMIKAIAMDPSHIEAHAKLGTLYLNQEQYPKAELIFRKLVLVDDAEPVYFSNLGLALFQQEKYTEAKEYYEKAIELDPSRPGRFYSLARVNHLLDEMETAFRNIEKALEMDPDNLDYGLTLANWQLEKGMYTEVKALLENITKHWPDNEEAKELVKMLEEQTK